LVYGRVVSVALDPIEKKPLFHFLPGADALSLATVGCNFRCDFCQNYHISQYPRDHGGRVLGEWVEPEELVRQAQNSGSPIIAYTYTEPTVFFEFAYEVAKRAHPLGIKNVFVTNGYMTREALDEVTPYLDGANVDLKAFREETYRRYMGATLQPVLDTIEGMYQRGIWVEVTTLVIPGINDSEEELRWIAEFISGVSPDIPWHISRFFPAYKMHAHPPTSLSALIRAWEIGKEVGLNYVYLGNVPGQSEDTVCPSCEKVLIHRYGFLVEGDDLSDGACPRCGTRIPGVWS